ncbi:MAG: nucleotidyl transferase AbiEii/AbiGii toxin family protein [Candidatus Nomurabacteria bacterium]|nr:nucleotidyl transferase AbiEii/AbiGii toxin family protein [Candidatus Nomurabacteria bacterium]
MNNQILMKLKSKLDELAKYGEVDVETKRNALKEDLQYYVLEFIYHHSEYRNWTMYGGSALRICHSLNRMSVDLDVANRSLLLIFKIGDELNLGHASKQVHVKIDLNHFIAPKKTAFERIPISVQNDQISFVIKTYNLSTLMASKIAAIFLRESRGIDKEIYKYKGRDIYDLLWYMGKKIVPDLDYITAKAIPTNDPKELFNRLSIDLLNYEKMDALLKEDLTSLFINQSEIEGWLKTWRTIYLRLLDEYKIRTISSLAEIVVLQDFHNDNFSFIYYYKTEEGVVVRVVYTISDYWMEFGDGNISIKINDKVVALVKGQFENSMTDKLKQYTTLFYEKTEAYFKKTKKIMFGDIIITKVVRLTADNLNYKEQIVLTKSALLSCELDDLLK